METVNIRDRQISTTRVQFSTVVWFSGGVALLLMATLLAATSQYLWDRAWTSNRVMYMFVAPYVTAGVLFLLVVGALSNTIVTRRQLAWIVLAGLLMRVVLLPSAPALETDSFRYMWDGALTAHGISPYSRTPADGQRALADPTANPALRSVAQSAGFRLNWMNHAAVKTIYPPIAQGAFFLANLIKPWNGTAWRAVLLLFDLATLGLLLSLLRRLRLPCTWLCIYWWNPLVIEQFYCAGHYDVIALPFVLGALLFAINGRGFRSVICLAAGVAVKFWPAILLPLMLRAATRWPRRTIVAVGIFTLSAAVLLLPMLTAGRNGVAGTHAHAGTWESNDGLFQLVMLSWRHLLRTTSESQSTASAAARLTTAGMLLFTLAWLTRRRLRNPLELCEACLLAMAGLFLLIPTQFPWYYTWAVPFLALRPRWSLLLYTALLPLYYLQYQEPLWVWVEHIPVWVLLIFEFTSRRAPIAFFEPTSHEEPDSDGLSTVPTLAH